MIKRDRAPSAPSCAPISAAAAATTALHAPAVPSQTKAQRIHAAEFLYKAISAYPGQISILALAPLTNIAQALMLDPELGSKWVSGQPGKSSTARGGGVATAPVDY